LEEVLSGWAWARSPRLLEGVQSNFPVGLKEGAVVRGGPRLLEEVQTNFPVGLKEGAVVRGGPRLLEEVQTNFPVGLEEGAVVRGGPRLLEEVQTNFPVGLEEEQSKFPVGLTGFTHCNCGLLPTTLPVGVGRQSQVDTFYNTL
jgi:hypothetical protein